MSELTRRIIRVDVDPDGRCSFFYSDMHDDPFESNEYIGRVTDQKINGTD
jgi:hypothetical protein